MNNSYFQFKQFRIEQGNCAMKVSTDACLQGAWAPVPDSTTKVLDIGCGTGLLSLMLAQRFSDIQIDAIEIDAAAAGQAAENITASRADRITLSQQDINEYQPTQQYDFIICNPPFFIDSLKGPQQQRNDARHNTSLTQQGLIEALQRLLLPNGTACFMWPQKEHETWSALLNQHGFFLNTVLMVRDKASATVLRCISICSRVKPQQEEVQEISIHNADRSYTEEFAQLLQPFYLKL